jgi:predicted phosphodiesterase
LDKRAVVIPDQHFPIHDEVAVKVVLKALELIKPDIFINLGDVGEWESVSAWKYKGKKLPPLEFQLPFVDEEIKEVNKQIDRFDAVLDKIKCKERYILAGNHDEWLDSFGENHSYLHEYNFKDACRWEDRGYEYRRYNEVLTIGKQSFVHGAYVTVNHAKKHLDSYGTNLIYGHTHDIQRYSSTSLLDGAIFAQSLGCLKDMSAENNKWLRGRLHNWNHCFGIVTWFKDGTHQLEVIDIVDGKCSVWGKIIKG